MAIDEEVDLEGEASKVTPSGTKSILSCEGCLVELRVSASRRDVHGDNVGGENSESTAGHFQSFPILSSHQGSLEKVLGLTPKAVRLFPGRCGTPGTTQSGGRATISGEALGRTSTTCSTRPSTHLRALRGGNDDRSSEG